MLTTRHPVDIRYTVLQAKRGENLQLVGELHPCHRRLDTISSEKCVSRYVTARVAPGVVALPLNCARIDGVFGSFNSLIPNGLQLTGNFSAFAPGGPS
jgi:hypothetical protein